MSENTIKKLWIFRFNTKDLISLIISVVLLLGALALDIWLLILKAEDSGVKARAIMITVFGFITPFLGLYIWYKYLPRYTPIVLNFLMNNFFGRLLIGGGNFAYYEYKPPEEKESIVRPVSRLVAVLIAFLGFAATFYKLLSKVIALNPKSPIDSWIAFIIWLLFMILIPVLLTPITPVVWALEDNKVKLWSKANKINWLASVKYKQRFNGLITIGVVVSGLGLEFDKLLENLTFLYHLIISSLLILLIPNMIIIITYYIVFKQELLTLVKETVPLKTYETTLIEKGLLQKEPVEPVSEEPVEPVSEEPVEPVSEEPVEPVSEELNHNENNSIDNH